MNTINRGVVVVLFVFIICLGMSCEKPKTSVGIFPITLKENARRAALGLRPVGTNWMLYSSEFGEENWKISPGGYLAKKIHRDDQNRVQWEEDYYYSGRKFVAKDGDPGFVDWEMFTIHYDYDTGVLSLRYNGDDASIIALVKASDLAASVGDKLKIADKILERWSMSR